MTTGRCVAPKNGPAPLTADAECNIRATTCRTGAQTFLHFPKYFATINSTINEF
jgi:hypothetical protein